MTYLSDPQKPAADMTTTLGGIVSGKQGQLLHAETAWILYPQLTGPYVCSFTGSAAARPG